MGENKGSCQRDWFLNEDFWTAYAPVMFDTQRWSEAPTVAEAVMDIVGGKEHPGIKILDAGCGPGRIAVELACRDACVTGVDLIEPYLNAAKETADEEGVEIEFIQSDLREFVRENYFDAAVNLYTSFGYCKTVEEDALILKNIAKSLKLGGKFILEMTGREIAVRDFTSGEWFYRDGLTVLTEFTVENAWRGLRSHWIIYDEDGQKKDHTFVQRLYSALELKQLLLNCGFSCVDIFGDFKFSPYDEKARTMVLIAEK